MKNYFDIKQIQKFKKIKKFKKAEYWLNKITIEGHPEFCAKYIGLTLLYVIKELTDNN